MVSSKQQDVATDISSESKELSLEERIEKVRRDAYAAGFAVGEVDGLIDGREQGFAAGYDESFAEGHAVGFTDGYKWGLSQGKLLGYGTGLRKGRYEGRDAGTSEDYLLGYEKGLEAGEKEGFEDGRNFGKREGFNYSLDIGHEEGFANEVARASAEEHEKGFAEGCEQELNRHLATARKLLARGMSREEVEELTSFSSQEMAKIFERQ